MILLSPAFIYSSWAFINKRLQTNCDPGCQSPRLGVIEFALNVWTRRWHDKAAATTVGRAQLRYVSRDMQRSAFSIESILDRNKLAEARQQTKENATSSSTSPVIVRRPILLPRAEPMFWAKWSHGCCIPGAASRDFQQVVCAECSEFKCQGKTWAHVAQPVVLSKKQIDLFWTYKPHNMTARGKSCGSLAFNYKPVMRGWGRY